MNLPVTPEAPEPDHARAAVTRKTPETDYEYAVLCIMAIVHFIRRN